MHVLACLRMNAQQVGMPLPDDHAFIQEVKGWPGVTHAKRRAHGEPRTTSPKAYWRIPWATLRSLDGPDRDQFNKATPL
jgi:hypothetical protein